MKRTLLGLTLSALVTLFFLWLITRGFGQLMDLLRGAKQSNSGTTLLVVGLAVFVPLLFYRLRRARKARAARNAAVRDGTSSASSSPWSRDKTF